MARIKYASIVSSVSGSIGSATFQKGLFGDVLRNKPLPRRSNSPGQLNCRGIMQRVHTAWSALTAAERSQWDKFIGFASASIKRDRSILQSGHSYFIKLNCMRLLTGYAIQSVPLYGVLNVGQPSCNFSWSDFENEWNLDLNCTNPGLDLWFVFKISYKIPSNHAFNPSGLRYMDITPDEQSSFAMRDIYYALFGYYLQENDWTSFSIQYFGLTSSLISPVYVGTKQLF
jgi:hypothetical protein